MICSDNKEGFAIICQERYARNMGKTPILLDSITDVTPDKKGLLAISGSHGGLYPAAIASAAGLRAVIFNDAGIGLDQAGIAGVLALEKVGMAAATIDCMSARIGAAKETYENGTISLANAIASDLGISKGMTASKAATLLKAAPMPHSTLPQQPETRQTRQLYEGGEIIHLLDSASMLGSEHIGAIVVTGSHGALIGGNPERALKAAARIAVFNDAGMGPENCGCARLPALDITGIAAVTVSSDTARIGDAASALETGTISVVNQAAKALGASPGLALGEWLRQQDSPVRSA